MNLELATEYISIWIDPKGVLLEQDEIVRKTTPMVLHMQRANSNKIIIFVHQHRE